MFVSEDPATAVAEVLDPGLAFDDTALEQLLVLTFYQVRLCEARVQIARSNILQHSLNAKPTVLVTCTEMLGTCPNPCQFYGPVPFATDFLSHN